jgi:hypothetical protein
MISSVSFLLLYHHANHAIFSVSTKFNVIVFRVERMEHPCSAILFELLEGCLPLLTRDNHIIIVFWLQMGVDNDDISAVERSRSGNFINWENTIIGR